MSVQVLACQAGNDYVGQHACLSCSTSDVVFGPLIGDAESYDIDDELGDRTAAWMGEEFVKWLDVDPRELDGTALALKFYDFTSWLKEGGLDAPVA